MKTNYYFLLLIVLVACTPQVSQLPTATAESLPAVKLVLPSINWAGEINHADGSLDSILLQLGGEADSLIIQPESKIYSISELQLTETAVTFTVQGPPLMHFSGVLMNGQLSGDVEQSGQTSSFNLLPLLVDSGLHPEFVGTYQFESGQAITIHQSPSFSGGGLDFFWSGLTLTNFGNGDIRGLYPAAPDMFWVGSARVKGAPFEAQLTFERGTDGTVSGLTLQQRNPLTGELKAAQTAARLELLTETVEFISADGVKLVGLLTEPATSGPHPAMVVLHGSERGQRDDFFRQQMRTFLASQGFAVLTYDKRGVGDSDGVYQESASNANLTRLAEDVLAGVSFLKSRPEVAAQQIGLIGASQAGWVIPLAAQQSADIAFFVILSGPMVSVGVEDAYSALTNNGSTAPLFSAEEISRKLKGIPVSGFDPMPVVSTLTQPGLWLWGEQDKSIPVPESMVNLESLINAGQVQFSEHVFANADHNLQQSEQGLFTEIPYSTGYPQDFFERLAAWLMEQVH